jgi:DNA-directed RNA polymerase specialized sigma24 family protein
MSRKKREGEYYIEPKVFKASLKKYYDSDVLTDDLAENIKKIAYGLSYNSNFINYTYKDDMIGDALVKMYAALKYKKYKFESNSNPFSYFTTIAFNAFINRIKKEKKHHEALTNYKEQVYEAYMTNPENTGGGVVYVKPVDEEDDLYHDQ